MCLARGNFSKIWNYICLLLYDETPVVNCCAGGAPVGWGHHEHSIEFAGHLNQKSTTRAKGRHASLLLGPRTTLDYFSLNLTPEQTEARNYATSIVQKKMLYY